MRHLRVPAAVSLAEAVISPLPLGPIPRKRQAPRAVVSSGRSARDGIVSVFCKDGISVLGRQLFSSREGIPGSAIGGKLQNAIRVNTAGKSVYTHDSSLVHTSELASNSWKQESLGTLYAHLGHDLHYMETVLTARSKVLCVWSLLQTVLIKGVTVTLVKPLPYRVLTTRKKNSQNLAFSGLRRSEKFLNGQGH